MSRNVVLISYTVLALGLLGAGLAMFPGRRAKPDEHPIVTCVNDVHARITCDGLAGELRNDCHRLRQQAIAACIDKNGYHPGVLDRIRPSRTRALRCLDRSAVTPGQPLSS